MNEIAPRLKAGSLTLQRMSIEELRAELAATLTITARHLVHLADVWRELERRGEDLSELRSGLWTYMPMIARGDVRAELVVRYAGHMSLLKRVARLPLADQKRLIDDDHVTIVEAADGSFVERSVRLSRIKGPDLARVIGDTSIITPERQRRVLSDEARIATARGARPTPAPTRDRPRLDGDAWRTLARAAAERSGTRLLQRNRYAASLAIDPGEQAALTEHALRLGVSVGVLVASAIELAGLLSEPRRVCRRPQLLRGRGYDEQDDEQVLT